MAALSEILMKNIKQFFQKKRNEAGLASKDLTEMLGIFPSRLSHIETGRRPLNSDIIVGLKSALKLTDLEVILMRALHAKKRGHLELDVRDLSVGDIEQIIKLSTGA